MIDVRRAVERYLQTNRELRERTHKVFYASELGYCPLKIFFSITRPRMAEVRALKVFKLGDLAHEFVQQVLQDTYGAEAEVPIRQVVDDTRGIELHGRIDVLHEGVPYELKSAARLPDSPYDHHVAQINAYLNLLGADEGYLVYVEKNSFEIAQFPVRRDADLWRRCLEKIRLVHDAVETDSQSDLYSAAGEHLDEGNTWECRYCTYRDICPLAMMR